MIIPMKPTSLSRKQATPALNRAALVVILGLLAGLAPLCIDLYLPAFPQMAEELNTSASMIQLSLTACLLGIALGQIIIGPISDVYGRKRPLLISLFLFTVMSVCCAFRPPVEVLIGFRFVQGLAGAGGIVLSRAIARDMYAGPELTKFFSLLMLINGLAPILSPVAGAQLIKVTDWSGVFVILGILGILLLLGSALQLKETLAPESRSSGGLAETLTTFGHLARDRRFMGLVLAQALATAGMFGYISGSPFVLQQIYGLSAQAYSLCFAVNGAGIIAAAQLSGRIAGKIGEAKALAIGIIVSLAGSLLVFAAIACGAPLFLLLPPLFVVISCIGWIGTLSTSMAMQSQDKSAGSASALLGLLPFILGAAVAPLVGLGGEGTALPMAIVIAGANVLAGVSYFGLARRKEHKA